MKRKLSLIAFLGLTVCAMLTGCNEKSSAPTTPGAEAVTNAVATNAPAH